MRSNARIEAYHLSQILIHSINSITNNLRALSNATAVLNGEAETIHVLLNSAQDTTRELTSGYFWLDKNGKVIAWNNNTDTDFINHKGLDLRNSEYFLIPRNTHLPYYSSVIQSDGSARVYISFPVLGKRNNVTGNSEGISTTRMFEGVIVSAINVDTIGNFLQNKLSPEFISNVGLMDKNGIILYARNQSLIGKHFLSKEFQSTIPTGIKDPYNDILRRSLERRAGAEDISFYDKTTTISYQPVIIDGKRLWTLYIGSPHNLTSDVGLLIDQQKNFSTLVVIIIGSIAVGIAFLILSWNKRLEASVANRTMELKKANDSLIESNRLLAAANEQLKVHDKMQKEFINIAAHELRTPIMPILGDAQYIERQFSKKDEKIEVEKDQISSLIRNAKRLDRLASDILDVTKIESKSLKLNKEKFNLKDIISSSLVDVKRYDSGNSNSRVLYRPKDIFIEADKWRITQVITNLLSNAIKFTEDGTIMINTDTIDNKIIVSVSDTGCGVHPEVFPRLFSKFVTNSDNGTGLGLFISKSIIESHGGKIWARNNTDGRGATFSFTLPASA